MGLLGSKPDFSYKRNDDSDGGFKYKKKRTGRKESFGRPFRRVNALVQQRIQKKGTDMKYIKLFESFDSKRTLKPILNEDMSNDTDVQDNIQDGPIDLLREPGSKDDVHEDNEFDIVRSANDTLDIMKAFNNAFIYYQDKVEEALLLLKNINIKTADIKNIDVARKIKFANMKLQEAHKKINELGNLAIRASKISNIRDSKQQKNEKERVMSELKELFTEID